MLFNLKIPLPLFIIAESAGQNLLKLLETVPFLHPEDVALEKFWDSRTKSFSDNHLCIFNEFMPLSSYFHHYSAFTTAIIQMQYTIIQIHFRLE